MQLAVNNKEIRNIIIDGVPYQPTFYDRPEEISQTPDPLIFQRKGGVREKLEYNFDFENTIIKDFYDSKEEFVQLRAIQITPNVDLEDDQAHNSLLLYYRAQEDERLTYIGSLKINENFKLSDAQEVVNLLGEGNTIGNLSEFTENFNNLFVNTYTDLNGNTQTFTYKTDNKVIKKQYKIYNNSISDINGILYKINTIDSTNGKKIIVTTSNGIRGEYNTSEGLNFNLNNIQFTAHDDPGGFYLQTDIYHLCLSDTVNEGNEVNDIWSYLFIPYINANEEEVELFFCSFLKKTKLVQSSNEFAYSMDFILNPENNLKNYDLYDYDSYSPQFFTAYKSYKANKVFRDNSNFFRQINNLETNTLNWGLVQEGMDTHLKDNIYLSLDGKTFYKLKSYKFMKDKEEIYHTAKNHINLEPWIKKKEDELIKIFDCKTNKEVRSITIDPFSTQDYKVFSFGTKFHQRLDVSKSGYYKKFSFNNDDNEFTIAEVPEGNTRKFKITWDNAPRESISTITISSKNTGSFTLQQIPPRKIYFSINSDSTIMDIDSDAKELGSDILLSSLNTITIPVNQIPEGYLSKYNIYIAIKINNINSNIAYLSKAFQDNQNYERGYKTDSTILQSIQDSRYTHLVKTPYIGNSYFTYDYTNAINNIPDVKANKFTYSYLKSLDTPSKNHNSLYNFKNNNYTLLSPAALESKESGSGKINRAFMGFGGYIDAKYPPPNTYWKNESNYETTEAKYITIENKKFRIENEGDSFTFTDVITGLQYNSYKTTNTFNQKETRIKLPFKSNQMVARHVYSLTEENGKGIYKQTILPNGEGWTLGVLGKKDKNTDGTYKTYRRYNIINTKNEAINPKDIILSGSISIFLPLRKSYVKGFIIVTNNPRYCGTGCINTNNEWVIPNKNPGGNIQIEETYIDENGIEWYSFFPAAAKGETNTEEYAGFSNSVIDLGKYQTLKEAIKDIVDCYNNTTIFKIYSEDDNNYLLKLVTPNTEYNNIVENIEDNKITSIINGYSNTTIQLLSEINPRTFEDREWAIPNLFTSVKITDLNTELIEAHQGMAEIPSKINNNDVEELDFYNTDFEISQIIIPPPASHDLIIGPRSFSGNRNNEKDDSIYELKKVRSYNNSPNLIKETWYNSFLNTKPQKTLYIGDEAFYGSKLNDLTQVVNLNSDIYVGDKVFTNSKLKKFNSSIINPNSYKYIGEKFLGVTYLALEDINCINGLLLNGTKVNLVTSEGFQFLKDTTVEDVMVEEDKTIFKLSYLYKTYKDESGKEKYNDKYNLVYSPYSFAPTSSLIHHLIFDSTTQTIETNEGKTIITTYDKLTSNLFNFKDESNINRLELTTKWIALEQDIQQPYSMLNHKDGSNNGNLVFVNIDLNNIEHATLPTAPEGFKPFKYAGENRFIFKNNPNLAQVTFNCPIKTQSDDENHYSAEKNRTDSLSAVFNSHLSSLYWANPDQFTVSITPLNDPPSDISHNGYFYAPYCGVLFNKSNQPLSLIVTPNLSKESETAKESEIAVGSLLNNNYKEIIMPTGIIKYKDLPGPLDYKKIETESIVEDNNYYYIQLKKSLEFQKIDKKTKQYALKSNNIELIGQIFIGQKEEEGQIFLFSKDKILYKLTGTLKNVLAAAQEQSFNTVEKFVCNAKQISMDENGIHYSEVLRTMPLKELTIFSQGQKLSTGRKISNEDGNYEQIDTDGYKFKTTLQTLTFDSSVSGIQTYDYFNNCNKLRKINFEKELECDSKETTIESLFKDYLGIEGEITESSKFKANRLSLFFNTKNSFEEIKKWMIGGVKETPGLSTKVFTNAFKNGTKVYLKNPSTRKYEFMGLVGPNPPLIIDKFNDSYNFIEQLTYIQIENQKDAIYRVDSDSTPTQNNED